MDLFRRFSNYYLNTPALYGRRQGDKFIPYEPNSSEKLSQLLINTLNFIYGVCLWTSPVWACFGVYEATVHKSLPVKYAVNVAICCATYYIAMALRAVGRMKNETYSAFLADLKTLSECSCPEEAREILAKYDGEFRVYPVDFQWKDCFDDDVENCLESLPAVSSSDHRRKKSANSLLDAVAWLCVNTFGRRMLFPGSTATFNCIIRHALYINRVELICRENAQRYKLVARDGNAIDCLFVDRRTRQDSSSMAADGQYLVICCEGNAGFYEVGCMKTPLEAKCYSVLGWNHPGFGGSTGVPWPDAERNAIDIVMQFAIRRLGYARQNIILWAWSIGGFPATFAARKYRNIKALILDATFDDIFDLAEKQMPPIVKPIVDRAVANYLDLNNAGQLAGYDGPVRLIRRLRDEIVTMSPGQPDRNKSNDVLIELLTQRYPTLTACSLAKAELLQALTENAEKLRLHRLYGVESVLCMSLLQSYVDDSYQKLGTDYVKFPCQIGQDMSSNECSQLLLYLADQHMADFDSTHCTPLPASRFQLPWLHPEPSCRMLTETDSSHDSWEMDDS